MRVFLIIGSLLGFATCALGFVSARSDIQLILAAVGLFSGFALLGLSAVVERADQSWRLLRRWDAERGDPSDGA